jgi:hypothetical protein
MNEAGLPHVTAEHEADVEVAKAHIESMVADAAAGGPPAHPIWGELLALLQSAPQLVTQILAIIAMLKGGAASKPAA